MSVLRTHRLEFNNWIARIDPGAETTLQAVDIGISIGQEDSHRDGHYHNRPPQKHLLKRAENRDCGLSSPLGENIKHNGQDQDNALDDLLPK